MLNLWIFLCVVFPILAGIVAFLDKGNQIHKKLVVITGSVLAVSSLMLAASSPVSVPASSGLAALLQGPIALLDYILLGVILWIGYKRNHSLIIGLAAVQLLGMFVVGFSGNSAPAENARAFTVDILAVTLVLVVSFVGSLIAYFAEGYMKVHEEHQHLTESKRPRFFALIFIFLGAMNGLALADDLTWLYFFWEVTTLCSFLLISHDGTAEAEGNADRALWMNLLGGAAFVFALIYLQRMTGTLSIAQLAEQTTTDPLKPIVVMLPMVALCFAGFTKSAQIPFQSWLCGAMVAPTPVSALLHSSTMVKAGVYLVLRLAPLYAGTSVSSMVAICGAFTFIAAAGFAVGQSNAKKVLAYSTISNLGLIVACAGINTKASIAAGIMLLIFHAISKALLFLCVGTIEQRIGSRNIEDMRGLFAIMPRTAMLTTFGIFTMMLPPFGMLLAKWMALESSIDARAAMPFIVTMLALGSGLTVLFWARWAGLMLGSANPRIKVAPEAMDETMLQPLRLLAWGAAGISLLAPILYQNLIMPGASDITIASGRSVYVANGHILYIIYPIYLLLAIGFRYAWKEAEKYANITPSLPYMGGMQAECEGKVGFIGPMKTFVASSASNYYLHAIFGEDKITKTINTIGIALLAMLLGGVLQ